MKNIIKLLLAFSILFCLSMSLTVFAVGDGNVDAGGGGMNNGTSTDSWSP